jgi:hypothetical protein
VGVALRAGQRIFTTQRYQKQYSTHTSKMLVSSR